MKMRSDFVTNSSSSSFVVARKGALSTHQKEALVDFVESVFLGPDTLTPTATDKEVDDFIEEHFLDYRQCKERMVRKAHDDGYDVCAGFLTFDDAYYQLTHLYQRVWHILSEAADDGTFITIDDSFEY